MKAGRLFPDGVILQASGQSVVSKVAIEPVWYLPEIARRFKCTEVVLRQSIFRMTNGMYPELITRPDLKIFLPPIGNLTCYIWGGTYAYFIFILRDVFWMVSSCLYIIFIFLLRFVY
jgi:hypothetical protein